MHAFDPALRARLVTRRATELRDRVLARAAAANLLIHGAHELMDNTKRLMTRSRLTLTGTGESSEATTGSRREA